MQLDCHSRESALQSISRIFAAPAVDIDAYLACVDLDAYYEEHDPDTSPDRTITALLEEALGRTSSEVTEVFWFHLTRVLPGEDFMKGIQPLDDALDGIWRLLFKVFEESEHFKNLNDLRNSGVPNLQYRLRVGKPFHCGPYAILVREAAFRAEEIGNHDYLAVPEIVRDICRGYEERFNASIVNQVTAALRPCIVKFKSKPEGDQWCLEPAVYYLHRTARGERLNLHANTCYDGGNSSIPPQDIVGVEFV